jgi:hypothetical protein
LTNKEWKKKLRKTAARERMLPTKRLVWDGASLMIGQECLLRVDENTRQILPLEANSN